MKTVATLSGFKAHYAKPGSNATLCGREISNATTGDDMCKRCVTAKQKLDAYADRTAYDAGVAETQDHVMNESTDSADQIVKRENLSPKMIEKLTAIASGDTSTRDLNTIVALIDRGLVTTATVRTEYRHELTDKGRAVLAEMNEAAPVERTGVDLTAEQRADKTIREHKLSDTMVETLTYRYSSSPEAVNAEMWCDARTEAALVKRGLMHPTKSHRTPLGHEVAQILMAPYAKPATEIPGQIDGLEIIAGVETEAQAATCHDCRKPVGTDHAWNCRYARNGLPSPQPVAYPAPNDLTFWQRLGSRKLSYRTLDGLAFLVTGQSDGTQTTGTWQSLVDLGYVIAHTNGVQIDHEITASGTAAYRFIMGTADPAPKIPAQRPKPDTQTERDTERDAYAKTVAVQYSRQHRQIGVLCNDGSILQPDSLIREIRFAMADIVMSSTRDVVQVAEDVTRLAELGWLLAYVMEAGTVDTDGWQDRRRPAVPGWQDADFYDLDTDSADALPAWADRQQNDEGCQAVIRSGGYDDPAEHCGTPVTRAEYYAAGDEGIRCDSHRAAFERAGDEPW